MCVCVSVCVVCVCVCVCMCVCVCDYIKRHFDAVVISTILYIYNYYVPKHASRHVWLINIMLIHKQL